MKDGFCVALVSLLALAQSEAQVFEISNVRFNSLTLTTLAPGQQLDSYEAEFQYTRDPVSPASGNMTALFFLSVDQLLDPGADTFLGTTSDPVGPFGGTLGEGITGTSGGIVGVEVPAGMAPGVYRALIVVGSLDLGLDIVPEDNIGLLAGSITVVPEVSTTSLVVAVGCLGLGLLRRVRRSAAA